MPSSLPTRNPAPAQVSGAVLGAVAAAADAALGAAHAAPPQPAADDAAAAAAAGPVWHVRLLGALEARRGKLVVNHFPTRAAGALLARLALQPERAHPREELVELLWPGAAPEVGRNRLRQTLSTLKSTLQAGAAGDVWQADRSSIRALPGALACDVRQFDRLARAGNAAAARDAYTGELMPGFYEDWVIEERQRLAVLFERMDQRALRAALTASSPPALAAAPPAVAPAPSGLPHFWTRSVGAEMAASRLTVLVRQQRLVTVHGPGGSGKTRLAVEVAQGLREEAAPAMQQLSDLQHLQQHHSAARFDRVSFVPLVDCVTAAQMLDAISKALQLESGGGQAHNRIVATLHGVHTLLVLDNLEQLEAPACQALADLLGGVPGLHVLATSRLLLDLDGEQAFELDGLVLPNSQATLEEVAINPAVLLFVDRARAARADFHLSAGNVHAVSGLVRLLAGMPLAIELAASRVRSLSPAELLQRLSAAAGTPMLDLLARSAQRTTAGSRHASMRHVVDWSWRQLSPEQAELMRAMTVFGAPAMLPAVAAVAGLQTPAAQALLDTLCDACLVRHAADAQGRMRYSLQQPVREFAAEGWPAGAAQQARHRLRQWLAAHVAQALQRGLGTLAAEIAPDLPHLHAALLAAPADGQGVQALQLAVALRSYWDTDELPTSTLPALQQCLLQVQAAAEPGLLSDAHELLALAYSGTGQGRLALAHAEAAVASARQAGDKRRQALAQTRWVWSSYTAGHLETETLMGTLAQAWACAQRSGDLTAQAMVLRVQAPLVCNLQLDYVGAERLAGQGQALWEQVGNPAMARACLLGRATMWAWLGREEQALPVFQQCAAQALAEGDWANVVTTARQIGRVYVRLRRWPQAAEALRHAVLVGWQRRYGRGLANALLNLPEALLMAGHPQTAARLHGFALAHWARLYGAINRIEAAEMRRARRLIRLRLGPALAEALRAQGAAMELAAAVELALAPDAA